MTLREQIRQYLKKTGMKPYKLADMAKVPRPTIYRFLDGERDVLNKTAEMLRSAMEDN